jgi:hypothetical protein
MGKKLHKNHKFWFEDQFPATLARLRVAVRAHGEGNPKKSIIRSTVLRLRVCVTSKSQVCADCI